MRTWYAKHRPYVATREYLTAFVTAFLLFGFSVVVNILASIRASEQASNAVRDIVLSNVPVMQVDFLFTYAPILFWIGMVFYCMSDPRRLPFAVKSIALFILIRSVFINLTHLGPFPERMAVSSHPLTAPFSFEADFFFSGHTGLPLLMALVFWHDRKIRYIGIVAAVVFGAAVLLAHHHYTIDVAAAFFITPTIYRIAEKLFAKDRQLLLSHA